MKKSPIALAVALLLFGGWITYLGIQALRDRRPIVVSHAQLAVAQYDVEVDLAGTPLPKKVTVKGVRWAADAQKPADEIEVRNLPDAQGFVGPGTYIVPLVRRGNVFQVAGLPHDPGFQGAEPPPRIYPANSNVLRQFDQIRTP